MTPADTTTQNTAADATRPRSSGTTPTPAPTAFGCATPEGVTPIEDYAMLSDRRTAAMVDRRGSVDWLCVPRFDSEACFAAIVGTPENGRWLLGPARPARTERTYEDGTLVLVTEHTTDRGRIRVDDFMPRAEGNVSHLVRRITGLAGAVEVCHELNLRFGYGDIKPWVHRVPDHSDLGADEMLIAAAGPISVSLRGARLPHAENGHHRDRFTIHAGDTMSFVLSWWPSHEEPPEPIDVSRARARAIEQFRHWTHHSNYRGPYEDAVRTSLAVLHGLTDHETGGIVAAATMGLPEEIGGSRNWDYRYCWLRDASLTLSAFLECGHETETRRWRDWLLRAVAGDPARMQIMYGVDGRRDLPERELTHLPGYAGSRPVLVGNGAACQEQHDVLGTVMIALEMARCNGLEEDGESWALQRALVDNLISKWDVPDHGLWEIRGPKRRFTHSRAMIWAAIDRAISGIEHHGLPGPLDEWHEARRIVRDDVLRRGVDPAGHFRQHDETDEVDASLLLLAPIGIVDALDERYVATVAKIERDLDRDGLLMRYRGGGVVDGLDGADAPFLACSFWLVTAYSMLGRHAEAAALMNRLLALRNDVGLLSEEYDPIARRFIGNTPQAFSHLELIRAATTMARRAPTMT